MEPSKDWSQRLILVQLFQSEIANEFKVEQLYQRKQRYLWRHTALYKMLAKHKMSRKKIFDNIYIFQNQIHQKQSKGHDYLNDEL